MRHHTHHTHYTHHSHHTNRTRDGEKIDVCMVII